MRVSSASLVTGHLLGKIDLERMLNHHESPNEVSLIDKSEGSPKHMKC